MNSAGSIIAAAGLVPLIVGLDLRLRRAGFAAFVIGVGLLGWSLLQTPLHHLTGHPAIGLAAAVAGIAGLVIGGYIVIRWPWLFLLAVVATAPARVPFSVGHTDANLLVPLYLVIGAGAAATLWELVRHSEPVRATGWIGMALSAFVGWSAISMLWSADGHHGAIEMLFFYLPFGLMVARLAQLRIDRDLLRWALIVQVALAFVFATVALGQELTHHVFWNPGVEIENTYKSFFRVNSLFWDASIYARFMAVTLVLMAGVAIHRRASPWLLAGMAYVFVGMYFSYSQSGYLALAVGALALGAGLWSRKITLAIVGAGAVIGLGGAGRRAGGVEREQGHVGPAAPVAAHPPGRRGSPAARRGHGRLLEGGPRQLDAPLAGRERRIPHDALHGRRRAGAARGAPLPRAGRRGDRHRHRPGGLPHGSSDASGSVPRDPHELGLLQCLLRRPRDLDPDGS